MRSNWPLLTNSALHPIMLKSAKPFFITTARQVVARNYARKCLWERSAPLRSNTRLCHSADRKSNVVTAEAATLKWLDDMVIGMRLCPWANGVKVSGALRCRVSEAACMDSLLKDAEHELMLLKQGLTSSKKSEFPETTLLVVSPSSTSSNFADAKTCQNSSFLSNFRDFVHASWDLQALIAKLGLVEEIQIVLFHPEALHNTYKDSTEVDASDFSIRSPFPTFHFLREKDVLDAVKDYPAAHRVPDINRDRLRAAGVATLASALARFRTP